MRKPYIIAIDGPAGSGKSTTAAGVAKSLSLLHLDTGAMYRAVTLLALEKGIKLHETEKLKALSQVMQVSFRRDADGRQRVFLGARDVSEAIRSEQVTLAVPEYCKVAGVREAMVRKQREAAAGNSIVVEGRDIGTVVFPDADFKFFLTASVEERAKRRLKDFERLGEKPGLSRIIAEIQERDRIDGSRELSPLKKAGDAEVVDTTGMTIQEQVDFIVNAIKGKLNHKP
jgi:cytidylate kinase